MRGTLYEMQSLIRNMWRWSRVGSAVIDILEPVQSFVGGPEQETNTVIKVAGDESMDEFFSNRFSEGRSEG